MHVIICCTCWYCDLISTMVHIIGINTITACSGVTVGAHIMWHLGTEELWEKEGQQWYIDKDKLNLKETWKII